MFVSAIFSNSKSFDMGTVELSVARKSSISHMKDLVILFGNEVSALLVSSIVLKDNFQNRDAVIF